MKYYEFGKNFEYYALIGSKHMDTAIEFYLEHIGEDIGNEKPNEITQEKAREKLLELYDCECEKEKLQANIEFDIDSAGEEDYLIIIDDSLF